MPSAKCGGRSNRRILRYIRQATCSALQLRALYHELVDGGKMTPRGFHDAVLQENSIPIEMVCASLTKQPLTRDYKTNWRFDD